MAQNRQHYHRRTSCTASGVAVLATTLTSLVSLCTVAPTVVRCQRWIKRPWARSGRTMLQSRGGYDQVMGFGKYKSNSFAAVIGDDPEYCRWILKKVAEDGPRAFHRMISFAEYFREADPYVSVKVDLACCKQYMESEASYRVFKTDDRLKSNLSGKTYRDILRKYVDTHVVKDNNDPAVGWALVSYKQDLLGSRLVKEGLISGARVYGGNSDPFSLPSTLNELATDKFYVNVDDSKAHPRYMRALTQIPEAKRVLDDFLNDPETMMTEVAQHYFSDSSADSLKKVKVLFLSLGMDGSVRTWRKEHAVNPDISEHQRVSQYAAVMPGITQEFAQLPEGQRAIKLIVKEFPDRTNPERTWKSFLLQEIEFVSFQAKAQIAKKYDGHGSIEHDGLKLLRGPKLQLVHKADLERELTQAVTAAVHSFVKDKYHRDDDDPVTLPVWIKPASLVR